MKNKFYYLFLIVFIYQTNFAQQFRAGFSGGLVATDIDGADSRDGDNDFHKLGFTLGGIVNTPINKKNTFQFEINFIQKGSMQPPDSNNMGYYKIALSYIEVPVLIKRRIYFTIRKKPVSKFDLEYGFSAGKLLQHSATGNNNYSLTSSKNAFNPFDISLLAGADYNISKNVYFCFRYSNSVIPAIKRNTPNLNFITYTFNKGNNMVFQFSFKFVFGGKAEDPAPVKVETETEQP
jgi:hypothetical protein